MEVFELPCSPGCAEHGAALQAGRLTANVVLPVKATGMQMRRDERPVFIVGTPRSGTTLLYDMLLSSGQFAVYLTETHVFSSLVPKFGDLRRQSNRERLIAEWLDSDYFKLSGLNAQEVRDSVLADCRDGGDFLRIVMGGIARTQNVPRWAEKTPDHLLYLREIKRTLPEALIVHIIRDGRDVAVSLERQQWARPFRWDKSSPLLVCGIYWEWMVQNGIDLGRALGPDYMEVHFEKLVRYPQQNLNAIGEFIGCDLDYEYIRAKGVRALNKPNTSFDAKNGGSNFDPVERWKTQFPVEVLKPFELLLGPSLTKMGYPLAITQPNSSEVAGLRRMRALYRTYYSMRLWLKSHSVPLAKHFVRGRS